ncbi:MAG: hypothetical protein IT269_01500, partial [Saprospiraceae bacterium]|nr:hypothetical protein [Saprospiraceae bacterium]
MKHLAWFAGLAALFLLGDRLVSINLSKTAAESGFRYSRLYDNRAQADVLLLGNSRGLPFYQPYIEQITGLKTFNFSYNGLPIEVGQVLVEDYLDRYPLPKILVIDITLLDRDNDELLSGFLTWADRSARLDALIARKLPKVWYGSRLTHLLRYNNELFHRAIFYKNKTDEDWLLDRVINDQLVADLSKNQYDIRFPQEWVVHLQQTVAYARAKGCRVELVIGPYFPGFRVLGLDDL